MPKELLKLPGFSASGAREHVSTPRYFWGGLDPLPALGTSSDAGIERNCVEASGGALLTLSWTKLRMKMQAFEFQDTGCLRNRGSQCQATHNLQGRLHVFSTPSNIAAPYNQYDCCKLGRTGF